MNASEIHSKALALPQDERATLLAQLASSLPAVLSDHDDGSEEAGRRLAEMRSDESARMSWKQVKAEVGRA